MVNKIVRIKFEKWQSGYKNLHNKIGFWAGRKDCYGNFILDLENGGWACVHKQNLEILKFYY